MTTTVLREQNRHLSNVWGERCVLEYVSFRGMPLVRSGSLVAGAFRASSPRLMSTTRSLEICQVVYSCKRMIPIGCVGLSGLLGNESVAQRSAA